MSQFATAIVTSGNQPAVTDKLFVSGKTMNITNFSQYGPRTHHPYTRYLQQPLQLLAEPDLPFNGRFQTLNMFLQQAQLIEAKTHFNTANLWQLFQKILLQLIQMVPANLSGSYIVFTTNTANLILDSRATVDQKQAPSCKLP